MRRLALGLAFVLGACTPTLPEGQYVCVDRDECPPGWSCVDGLCRRSADAAAPRDAEVRDAEALDAPSVADGGVQTDGGTPGLQRIAVSTTLDGGGDAELGGRFGWSVDLLGEWLAVGAPGEGAGAGAVYVFQDLARLSRRVVAEPAGPYALGYAVAVTPEFVFAGRPGWNEVWRFEPGTSMVIPGQGLRFGEALSRRHTGNVAVGAPKSMGGSGTVVQAGRAFVYSATGAQVLELSSGRVDGSNPQDFFGAALASEEDLLAVGAPSDGDDGFVSIRDVPAPADTTAVVTSPSARDRFGVSVAFLGPDLLIVGADENTAGGEAADEVGRVHGFDVSDLAPPPARPTLVFTIVSPNGSSSRDRFGASACASGEYVVIGAPLADLGRGTAFLYRRDGLALVLLAELVAPAGVEHFGHACAIDGRTAVIGAPGIGASTVPGAALVYDLSPIISG